MTAATDSDVAPASAPGRSRRPALVLGVVMLAAFVINLDTTIVNVALPALSRQLHASTTDLQWIVDAYNLAFAALILTGGTIGDRFGRRRTLAAGLGVFALTSGLAALATGAGGLIALRVVMGAAAAFIFPTTLSIISQTFPDRGNRARAIGAWGATTGAAVALGPIVGGALLAHFAWGAIFLAMVPVAAIAMTGTLVVIPAGRIPIAHRLDVRGLTVAAVALGSLVYTIIQAPDAGWGSARTLAGFAFAVVAIAALVVVERREPHPMLDVTLFTNPRFTAASGAVTIAFFGLFGFTFLIIQYFQIMRGYSALEAGIRILPVAATVGIASGIGPALAVRIGNKTVVAAGLALLGAGFLWVSFQTATTPYGLIVGQMILLGAGLGLSTAPAIEAIMGVVKPEQAGAGSAVNDATRLVGGTLGVAVIGSVRSASTEPPSSTRPCPPPPPDTPSKPATPPATTSPRTSHLKSAAPSKPKLTTVSSTACTPAAASAPPSASSASPSSSHSSQPAPPSRTLNSARLSRSHHQPDEIIAKEKPSSRRRDGSGRAKSEASSCAGVERSASRSGPNGSACPPVRGEGPRTRDTEVSSAQPRRDQCASLTVESASSNVVL